MRCVCQESLYTIAHNHNLRHPKNHPANAISQKVLIGAWGRCLLRLYHFLPRPGPETVRYPDASSKLFFDTLDSRCKPTWDP